MNVGLFYLTSVFQIKKRLEKTRKLIIAQKSIRRRVIDKKTSILRELDSISTESTFSMDYFLLEVDVCESVSFLSCLPSIFLTLFVIK